MRMKLELEKDGTRLFEAIYDIADAESFGLACSELWMRLERSTLEKAANVGEFMELAGESTGRALDGAELRFIRV